MSRSGIIADLLVAFSLMLYGIILQKILELFDPLLERLLNALL